MQDAHLFPIDRLADCCRSGAESHGSAPVVRWGELPPSPGYETVIPRPLASLNTPDRFLQYMEGFVPFFFGHAVKIGFKLQTREISL